MLLTPNNNDKHRSRGSMHNVCDIFKPNGYPDPRDPENIDFTIFLYHMIGSILENHGLDPENPPEPPPPPKTQQEIEDEIIAEYKRILSAPKDDPTSNSRISRYSNRIIDAYQQGMDLKFLEKYRPKL